MRSIKKLTYIWNLFQHTYLLWFEHMSDAPEQLEKFNEANWHLALNSPNDSILVKELLDSTFPLKLQLNEWQDCELSKIDRRYYDITWSTKHPSASGETGLFIAFATADSFRDIEKKIELRTKLYLRIRLNVTLKKHDDPADPKSHPEWGCWLEATTVDLVNRWWWPW